MEFPIWLAFALVSPAFWAIVHVLDSYCVDKVFDRPWIGVITSGATILFALPLLSIGLAFTPVASMSATTIGMCVLCGFAFMASQLCYFQALSVTEAGIVAAYWNFIPLFLPISSFVLHGEVLSGEKYLGAGILTATSVAFCLLDGNLGSRWSSFWLMFSGAWLQVAYFLVEKQVFAVCPVYRAFLVITLSMGVAGISPLLIRRYRQVFRGNWPRIRPALRFLCVIEIANLIAIGTSQCAVNFGTPSLVSAVEASIPAYTFLLSLVLYVAIRKFGKEEARHRLPAKFILVAAMVFGVFLLS